MKSKPDEANLPSLALPDNAHIGIAGGGLLGRLMAWQLLSRGLRVSLFDAGSFTEPPAAAHTAAGMIAPVSEAVDSESLMYDLGAQALTQWPQWLAQLHAQTGEAISYGHEGSLVVAHPHDIGLLHQYQRDMQRMLPDCATPLVDVTQLHALEEDLQDRFQQGLWLKDEAHIDNRHLLRVLHQRIIELGGQCMANTPVSVTPYQLTTPTQTLNFDLVLDCRGVGAKPQWQDVRGVRGEVLRVQSNEIKLARPVRLLHPRYQLYVVPKPNGEFVIGATQIESEDRSPVSVQSALELNSALYTINPAFAEARIIEMSANLRPALRHNRPEILATDGLLQANGLYRHGYLLAPVVVQHLLAKLFGGHAPFAHKLYRLFEEPLSA